MSLVYFTGEPCHAACPATCRSEVLTKTEAKGEGGLATAKLKSEDGSLAPCAMLAPLNISKIWSEADLTEACPVK